MSKAFFQASLFVSGGKQGEGIMIIVIDLESCSLSHDSSVSMHCGNSPLHVGTVSPTKSLTHCDDLSVGNAVLQKPQYYRSHNMAQGVLA